jgi:PPOX class probable F420-dependent enzyme
MANERSRVAMSPDAVDDLLAGASKLHLATINPDGSPHLVTMFYAMHDGRVAFWTYRASQKARNLARDPRVTCLVEDGADYFELRGVQVNGTVEIITEPAGVVGIGRLIAARLPNVGAEILEEYVAHAARKRNAYLVTPVRVTSWDHRRLL